MNAPAQEQPLTLARIESLIRVYEHADANGPGLANALRELISLRESCLEYLGYTRRLEQRFQQAVELLKLADPYVRARGPHVVSGIDAFLGECGVER